MFTLELSVYAVLLHEGRLLLAKRAGCETACCSFPSTSIVLGKPLPASIESLLADEYHLQARAAKLLYLVEQAHARERAQVYEIAHYYVCEPVDADRWTPGGDALLLAPDKLLKAGFEPKALVPHIIGDAADGFQVSPKHVVISATAVDGGARSIVSRL